MGTVYEAEDTATQRHVALKLIAPEYGTSAESVQRFRQEGRLASAVAHSRCVFVLAADEEGGRPYIVMELMPGSTLKDIVEKNGPLPVPDAIVKILDVIDGLEAAHALGVIHRDVKPSNCFLDPEGRVKVGDFGLSKSLARDSHLTRTGAFIGTPLFASPEQARGEALDEQTDVYSVTATLYYLLTGRAPFQSPDTAIALARIVSDPPPSVRALRPEVSPGLDQVLLRGLERDRRRRYRTLTELRNALQIFVPGKLSIGGLGTRFGAYCIDLLVLLVAMSPITALQIQTTLRTEVSFRQIGWMTLLSVFLYISYFAIPEGLWGWSLGKRSLGLRVCRLEGIEPPGLLLSFWRTTVWWILISLGLTLGGLITPFFSTDPHPALWVLAGQWAVFLLGFLGMVSTMRTRNGYRGLHEVLSRTRVIRLPEAARPFALMPDHVEHLLMLRQGLKGPGREPVADRNASFPPQRLGTFEVRSVFAKRCATTALLAEDPYLGRKAIIELRAAGDETSRVAHRRETTRTTRLRWLAGGTHAGSHWDAFVAPAGCPLGEFIAATGKMAWPDFRPLLQQLTDELTAATADDTLPGSLEPSQVWVQRSGQVQLLDLPLSDASKPGESAIADQLTGPDPALSLLRDVTILALEGKLHAARRPLRAVLPEHASRVLNRLAVNSESYINVAQFQDALAASAELPTHVTRGRRALPLIVLALLLSISGGCSTFSVGIMTLAPLIGVKDRIERIDATRAALDKGAAHWFAVNSVNPSAGVRLAALGQRRLNSWLDHRLQQAHEYDSASYELRLRSSPWYARTMLDAMQEQNRRAAELAPTVKAPDLNNFYDQAIQMAQQQANPFEMRFVPMFGSMLLGFWAIVWIISAFAFRGGITFSLFGIVLVRADGRKASRIACAWRAFLVWAPVYACLAGSLWLDVWLWPPHIKSNWVIWLPWAAWWLGLLLLPLFAALALWRPERSLHDRLAGTHLVPK
jgi:uncharacterized RDD family membrane protein YckC